MGIHFQPAVPSCLDELKEFVARHRAGIVSSAG
jgi:hypothetical protein